MTFKLWLYLVISSIGSVFLNLIGEWDDAMKTLVIFMIIDFITGFFVAIFKKSPKTETGGLSSKISFLGLCRKILIIFFVVICTAMDSLMHTAFIRDAAIIGFCINETLSIVENAGLLGLPLPSIISEAIELLKKKTEVKEND